jgi:GntR family phosphonate transport system transcriptional regulator
MTSGKANPFATAFLSAQPARGNGVAVWKQIAEQLTAQIRDRAYDAAGRLPSENELARRFGVNRHTLRQALAELQRNGLVSIEQGRGAFIRKDWLDYTLSRRTRYTDNVLGNRLAPGRQLLAAREIAAPEKVARELRLRKGTRVLLAEQLDEAGGSPVAVATSYFPAARFAGLLEKLQAGYRVTDALRDLGLSDYLRASSRITTQMPDEVIARLLQQPRTRPVLCVESVDVDIAGTPVKYGETLFSGDRVQLIVAEGAASA